MSPCFGAYGGVEAFVLALGRSINLSSSFRAEIAWKMCANYQPTDTFERERSQVLNQQFVVPRGSLALARLIKTADLVHAQNQPPDVALLCGLLNKPYVLTIHNYLKANGIRRLLWKWTNRRAKRRWYNSKFVQRTWEGDRNIKNSRVIPTVSELKEIHVEPGQRKGFIFVGRWIPNKGIEELIQAYLKLQGTETTPPLILLGEGPLREPLMQKYNLMNHTSIQCPGFVTNDEKLQWIARSRWLVAPSNTKEDMGLTPLEARMCGIPVIATRDGGLPESAGMGAILCKPGNVDDLHRALRDALNMSEEDYAHLSQLTKIKLKEQLVPMEFYPIQYEEVLKETLV